MRWIDYLLLGIILFVSGAYMWWRRANPPKKKRSDKTKLNRNEKAALEILQERGYNLHETHPVSPVCLVMDQKSAEINCQVNFVVRNQGKSYLVVIKDTGGKGTKSSSVSAFRKELLLKHLVFMPAGIFVYNPDNGTMHDVNFSPGGFTYREKLITRFTLILLIVLGVIIMAWFLYEGVSSS